MSEQAGKTPGVQAVKAKMSGHELADFFGRFRAACAGEHRIFMYWH